MTRSARQEIFATVSSKGQVVIPSEVRRRLNLHQGSIVRFIVENETVSLSAASGDVRRLKGRLQAPGTNPISVARMNELIAMRRQSIGSQAVAARRK